MRNRAKTLILCVLSAIIVIAASFTGYAEESLIVRNFSITVENVFGDGEVLEPTITFEADGCALSDITWSHETSRWKPTKKERVELTIVSDGKVFADHYKKGDCKLKAPQGTQYVSAKTLDNNTLLVRLDYIPVVNLGNTEQAGWTGGDGKRALWKSVPYATGYDVILYKNNVKKKTLKVEVNYVDLSDYMTEEANYYYEVRATGFTSQDRKYLTPGEYVLSSDVELDDQGDTTGEWKGDSYADAWDNYANNCWKLIQGKWYYFDAQGRRSVGWLLMGSRWFYMNSDGVMMTGWVKVNDKWYYLNPEGGEMMTGWVQTSPGDWYYLYQDGSMACDTWIGDYWVDGSGLWIPDATYYKERG